MCGVYGCLQCDPAPHSSPSSLLAAAAAALLLLLLLMMVVAVVVVVELLPVITMPNMRTMRQLDVMLPELTT